MANLRPADPKRKPAASATDDRAAKFAERLAQHYPEAAAALRAQLGLAGEAPAAPAAPTAPAAVPAAPRHSAPRPAQAHRIGPKPSRRERVQSRRQALQRRESNYLAALTDRVRAQGGHGVGIRAIPLRVWLACSQVVADPTGRAARIHLRQLRNRTAAGAILSAALQPVRLPGLIPHAPEHEQPEPQESAQRRSWASLRTRRIAALGLALTMLAAPTRRRGPWGGVVMGIPRGAFAALLRDPYDSRDAGTPAITTLFGTHRPGAAADSSQVGYFVALRAAGLAYRQQLPSHEASAYEIQGPSGHATNRYWVCSSAVECIELPEAREIAIALAELATADAATLAAQLRRERTRAPSQAPP